MTSRMTSPWHAENGTAVAQDQDLWSLRGLPGFDIVRAGCAQETEIAWQAMQDRPERPVGIVRSYARLTVESEIDPLQFNGASRGGYVLVEAQGGSPAAIVIGSGRQLQTAVTAAAELETEGVPTRVVSMPCVDWFVEQSLAYRLLVLPAKVGSRVSIGDHVSAAGRNLVGDRGECLSLVHSADDIVAATWQILARQAAFH